MRAVRRLLRADEPRVSAWWLAAVEPDAGACELAAPPQEAIARPRRTRGAERA